MEGFFLHLNDFFFKIYEYVIISFQIQKRPTK